MRAKSEKLKFLYEDEWIIVVEKTAGLLTMSAGREGEETAYSILTAYMAEKEGFRNGRARNGHGRRRQQNLFIVHRLDRDTSGILVFAKDFQTKEILQTHWDEIMLSRKYIAIVEGRPAPEEGIIRTWLTEDPRSLKVWSSPRNNGGKLAVTRYRTIRRNNTYSMIECELETGRKNQIRVHCAGMGCPIAGDRKYGAKTSPINRMALHAQSIVMLHPYLDGEFEFTSKLPNAFRKVRFDTTVPRREGQED